MKTVLVLVMVIAMIGCTSTGTQESTGEYVDDTFITSKVKDAFAAEPTVSASDIKAEVFKGAVQLRGTVDTAEQAQKAAEIAAGVKGVKSVQNNIAVKVVKQEGPDEYVDDPYITAKIKVAFASYPTIRALDIKAETFKGVVQLRGTVDTAEQALKASEIAAGVKGVKSVQNNIIVKVVKQESPEEYIDDSIISAKIRAALVAEPTISASDVKVEVYRGVVQLSGFVDTAEQVQKTGEIVAGINGVKSVNNNILVK